MGKGKNRTYQMCRKCFKPYAVRNKTKQNEGQYFGKVKDNVLYKNIKGLKKYVKETIGMMRRYVVAEGRWPLTCGRNLHHFWVGKETGKEQHGSFKRRAFPLGLRWSKKIHQV